MPILDHLGRFPVRQEVEGNHLRGLVVIVHEHVNHAAPLGLVALPGAVGERVEIESDEFELSGAGFHYRRYTPGSDFCGRSVFHAIVDARQKSALAVFGSEISRRIRTQMIRLQILKNKFSVFRILFYV